MNFNFELILFYLTLGCGLIVLADWLFLARKRRNPRRLPLLTDYARSFFPVLLVVFLLRSFLYEPFRIPSGSLKPTMQVGDFVLVNKFAYGIRLPVVGKKLIATGDIRRGDIMVFRYPPDPAVYFIKRVVGLPGDRISYINKEIFVNGQKMPQSFIRSDFDESEENGTDFRWSVDRFRENLAGVEHDIFRNPLRPGDDFENKVVPKGEYFVMGDNRDNSEDSRSWGFVPDSDVVGKASIIWMSWNASGDLMHKIRWNRIGRTIH